MIKIFFLLLGLIGLGIIITKHLLPAILWTFSFALILLMCTWFKVFPSVILAVLWLVFTTIALLIHVFALRHKLFLKPAFSYMKQALPPISETERIALEAGDSWIESQLFQGAPNWVTFQELPLTYLTVEEKKFLAQQVEALCDMLQESEIMKTGDLPEIAWKYLKKEKFWGLIIPKEYGGLGFSPEAHSQIITKISSRSLNGAVTVMVPNSLGPAELLLAYGTETQKQQYLPRLACGEEIPCFALTSLEAGSDATSITDQGIVCRGIYKNKEILGMRLNFSKRYITLAPIATLIGIAFKLYDPDHLLGEKAELGITLALIPHNVPGVEVGTRHSPLGLAFMNGTVVGVEVFVPLDMIIGGHAYIGEGWRMLMESLAVGRSISLPALSNGLSKATYFSCSAYTRLRYQFNVPIGTFEGIQSLLGEIGAYTYLLEASRLLTASAASQGVKPSLVSAIVKYHSTELARLVVNHGMDIHGGRGIQLGPRNYIGYHYLAIPICITVEGANILTRNLMIFGQGAIRSHPYLREEIDLINKLSLDTTKNSVAWRRWDKILFSHFFYTSRGILYTLWTGLTNGKLIVTRHIKLPSSASFLRKYYRQLTRMSSALSMVSEIAFMHLGGDLKRRECLSARLGDALSHLYLATSVLRYYHSRDYTAVDIPYVEWSLSYCLNKIETALTQFCHNLKSKWLSKLLYNWIFPWGQTYLFPLDELSQQIARDVMQFQGPSATLTQLCYHNPQQQGALDRLSYAIKKWDEAKPLLRKLQVAQKTKQLPRKSSFKELIKAATYKQFITEEEAKQLLEAEEARLEALKVDEFPFFELTEPKGKESDSSQKPVLDEC